MKEDIIKELQETIKKLKLEIIKKQEELEMLINQYQELTGIEIEEDK